MSVSTQPWSPVTDRRANRAQRFTIQDFLALESAGGICLLIATVTALVLANSPLGGAVTDFRHHHAVVVVGPIDIDESLGIVVGLVAGTLVGIVIATRLACASASGRCPTG